jgi:hypothetical protein
LPGNAKTKEESTMPFLDWVNKNHAKETSREVPYHLLKQEAVYGDGGENLLIQGDNLLALKALMPFYAGRVKCIFTGMILTPTTLPWFRNLYETRACIRRDSCRCGLLISSFCRFGRGTCSTPAARLQDNIQ